MMPRDGLLDAQNVLIELINGFIDSDGEGVEFILDAPEQVETNDLGWLMVKVAPKAGV